MGRSTSGDLPSIRYAAAGALALFVAYLVFRVLIPGSTALLLAQIVYVVPPLATAVFAALVVRRAPNRSQARVTWALLSAAAALLLVTEVAYSVRTLAGANVFQPLGGVSDTASVGSLVCLIAALVWATPSDTSRLRRGLRILTGAVASGALAFVVVYRFAMVPLIMAGYVSDVSQAVRLAAYSAVGVLLISATTMGAPALDPPRSYRSLLVAGVLTFSIGVVLWPVWYLGTLIPNTVTWTALLTSLVYLAGYLMMMLGALRRLVEPEPLWIASSSGRARARIWPRMIGSSVVLGAVVSLSLAVLDAPDGSVEQKVYLIVLALSAFALVATSLSNSVEILELRALAGTDAVTGAYNRARFDERLAVHLAAARRFGEGFALAVLDVDDLAEHNRTRGDVAGDALLSRIADGLASIAGRESVFRLTSDEFAVLLECRSSEEAAAAIHALLDAVREHSDEGPAVTASIGYAVCPSPACEGAELVRRAVQAQVWAKYHGKDRAVPYDESLPASSAEDLELLQAHPTLKSLISGLLALADGKDPDSFRHARNVSQLSVMVARQAGVVHEDLGRLELAALLHDVGKIAVTVESGRVAATRTNEAAMREHPVLGQRLVEALGMEDLPLWVRCHHERWDGSGYPDGLSGVAIPLQARIIALADSYDSMTAGTSTTRARSKAAALQEIDQGLGTRFDPELGEHFIRLVGEAPLLGWTEAGDLA